MENEFITIDDFAKLDLRVAKVLEAEDIEGSDKLLKLKVSLGEEERQILSGIKKSYSAEDMVGKEIIIVANLKPRMMMGLESQGMILATHDESDNIIIVSPEKEAPAGSKIG